MSKSDMLHTANFIALVTTEVHHGYETFGGTGGLAP